ncbi:MAG: tetratricopeptide repeat protein [Isosphaeraceae bacterium]
MGTGILILAAASSLAGPPRKSREEPPPTLPDGADPNTVSVDLSRSADGPKFRRNLTPAQRIHTHLDLGRVFESQGNFEAALMEYQQGLAACERRGIGRTSSADEALAHRRIGNALDRLGRFAQAEMHYKKAIKCNSRDAKAWNDAGYSYYLQGRWADAERLLRTAQRLAPEDPRIQTNLGLTLAAAGRTKEALPILSKFTGDAIGHANLGYLLAATGQVRLARDQYLQALALRPNLEIARRALARLDQAEQAEAVAATSPPIPQRSLPSDRPGPGDPAVARTGGTRPAIPQPRIVVPPPEVVFPTRR